MRKKTTFIVEKRCKLCDDNVKVIDYKDVATVRRYVSGYARIDSRRRTGNCMKHQRMVANAIKRARLLALIQFTNR